MRLEQIVDVQLDERRRRAAEHAFWRRRSGRTRRPQSNSYRPEPEDADDLEHPRARRDAERRQDAFRREHLDAVADVRRRASRARSAPSTMPAICPSGTLQRVRLPACIASADLGHGRLELGHDALHRDRQRRCPALCVRPSPRITGAAPMTCGSALSPLDLLLEVVEARRP